MKSYAKQNEIINRLTIKKRIPKVIEAKQKNNIKKIRMQDWRKNEVEQSLSPEREGKNVIDKWYQLNEYKANLFK